MPRRLTGDLAKVEDLLREEYFDRLAEIRRVVWQLETEIRFQTLPILQDLKPYEQLTIKSRVKDCESALKSLRRRQEGGTFDPERLGGNSLLSLPDLAAVRVLVFPRSRLVDVDCALKPCFAEWVSDPIPNDTGGTLVHKYTGFRKHISSEVRAEYQIVPMLIGLFWEVEHAALYKPAPDVEGKANAAAEPMMNLYGDVVRALSRLKQNLKDSCVTKSAIGEVAQQSWSLDREELHCPSQ